MKEKKKHNWMSGFTIPKKLDELEISQKQAREQIGQGKMRSRMVRVK